MQTQDLASSLRLWGRRMVLVLQAPCAALEQVSHVVYAVAVHALAADQQRPAGGEAKTRAVSKSMAAEMTKLLARCAIKQSGAAVFLAGLFCISAEMASWLADELTDLDWQYITLVLGL